MRAQIFISQIWTLWWNINILYVACSLLSRIQCYISQKSITQSALCTEIQGRQGKIRLCISMIIQMQVQVYPPGACWRALSALTVGQAIGIVLLMVLSSHSQPALEPALPGLSRRAGCSWPRSGCFSTAGTGKAQVGTHEWRGVGGVCAAGRR